jgi:hypothetical protein
MKRRTKMKRIQKLLLAMGIALAFTKVSHAAVSDALTVTITPNAFYALDIDTATVALDMGTVTLGASTQTVSPSTVTIQSTYATTDVKLQGSISGGWSFDTNTATSEQDALAAWATFTSVARSSAPTQSGDYFSGTNPGSGDVIDTNSRYVGTSANDGTSNLFENNSGFDSRDTDALAVNAQAGLWLYFRLPSATSSSSAKDVTVTLTAVQPN